jgi:hypothetical protein
MRSPGVVVRGIQGKHPAQVPLAEDQHSVGDLTPNGQHEALGEKLSPSTPRRDLDHLAGCITVRRREEVIVICRCRQGRRSTAEPTLCFCSA